MIRLSTVFWLLLVAVSGYAMFQVKYEVMQLEEEAGRLKGAIAEKREAIHVLNAEWSFLNQPARLDQLAKRHLTLAPINAKQIGSLETVPQRPMAAPAAVSAAPPAAPKPQSAPLPPAGGTKLAADKARNE